MKKKYISIKMQFLATSISAILIAITIISGITAYLISTRNKSDYFKTSNEQMSILENTIHIFYDDLDKNIDMMATNPLIVQADKTITSYNNTTDKVDMTPSKNGGMEQEIYNIFKQCAFL